MESLIVNTGYHTFLIKFRYQTTNGRFIVQGQGLMNCLKTYDKNGIEYIKIFDPHKYTFKQVSKETLFNLFSWDTETMEYFKNHYYFKK